MSTTLTPPIKRVLVFNWKFKDTKSMSELEERLSREFFYTYRPRDEIVVATSKSRPLAVIFVIVKSHSDGGYIILIETNLSWYSYEQVVKYMHLFSKICGLEIEIPTHLLAIDS